MRACRFEPVAHQKRLIARNSFDDEIVSDRGCRFACALLWFKIAVVSLINIWIQKSTLPAFPWIPTPARRTRVEVPGWMCALERAKLPVKRKIPVAYLSLRLETSIYHNFIFLQDNQKKHLFRVQIIRNDFCRNCRNVEFLQVEIVTTYEVNQ
jgi:hypothetical protein